MSERLSSPEGRNPSVIRRFGRSVLEAFARVFDFGKK